MDASGGTEKTFLTSAIQRFLKLKGKRLVIVASSAVSTQLLDDRRTAHFAFQIPIPVHQESSAQYNLEAVDCTLRDIERSHLPFDGKAVLHIGDFRQILSAVLMGNRSQLVGASFKRSRLYLLFNTLLIQEIRGLLALRRDGKVDPAVLQFPSFPLHVGERKLQETSSEQSVLPTTVQMARYIEGLIESVFPYLQNSYRDQLWLLHRAILTTRNRVLEMVNDYVGVLIPGKNVIYKTADTIDNPEERELHYPAELHNSILSTASLPNHSLRLNRLRCDAAPRPTTEESAR